MAAPSHAEPESRPSSSAAPPRLLRDYLLVLSATLVLYLISMAPGPLWQDSGLAQNRVLRHDLYGDLGLALSHPLYYVLAFAFQVLPFGESAFKTNLVSVVFGAVTVANVFCLVRLATGRRFGAAVGAVSLAVAHTFWQHCALAEVYTVTTALLTTELLCLFQYVRGGDQRWLIGLFLANGLGISNHMVAALSLACYAVAVLWLWSRRRVGFAVIALAGGAWLVGAGLYLTMIVVQIAGGAGVGETVHSALFGNTDPGRVLNVLPDARMLLNTVLILGLNFPTPAVLLVIAGVLALRGRSLRPAFVVLAGLLAVHLFWAIRYDVPDQYTFFIPAVVLLAVLIGLGGDRFLRDRTTAWKVVALSMALLPVAVYFALPTIARRIHLSIGAAREAPYRDTYAYFLQPWKTGYRGAERLATELHDALPEGAVIVLDKDSTVVRPFHYLQLTGRWTRNVRVQPPAGDPTLRATEQDLRSELDAGRVYVVSPLPGYCPEWLLERYEFSKEGIVHRASRRQQP